MTGDAGFDLITCDPADDALIADAIKEFQPQLDKAKKASSTEGWVGLRAFGRKCHELFHNGVDLTNNTFVARHCESYVHARKDEAIMSMVVNDKQLPPWKIAPGQVLIFKPVNHELCAEVGFLRYIEGSHKMSKVEEINSAEEKDIRVRLDQMLIMDGDLVIKWPKEGGGVCLLQGIMKKA